jgi:hypothetical protein
MSVRSWPGTSTLGSAIPTAPIKNKVTALDDETGGHRQLLIPDRLMDIEYLAA